MEEKLISLMICGNRMSAGGYETLYYLNEPPFPELRNLLHPGMQDNSYYFVISITEQYTQYTLVHNNVKSFGASRKGVLKISISIPKGYKIKGDATPLNVLLDVRLKFVTECMTPIPGLKEGFNFKERMVDDPSFVDVLSQYKLVACNMIHRPMTGTGHALLLTTNFNGLFRDVQYPEFSDYGEIVVAETGDYNISISGIEIHRKPCLTLYVNGEQKSWTAKNYYTEAITVDLGLNRECYDYSIVKFCVNDLIGSPEKYVNERYKVILDNAKEEVHCEISSKPKKKCFKVSIDGCDEEAACKILSDLKLKITLKDGTKKDIIISDGKFSLEGEELLCLSSIVLVYNSPDFIIKTKEWNDTNLQITVAGKNNPSSEPLQTKIPNKPKNNQPNILQVSIILSDSRDIKKIDGKYPIRLYRDGRSLTIDSQFSKEGDGFITDFIVGVDWEGEVELFLKTDTIKYERKIHLSRAQENKFKILGEETDELKYLEKNQWMKVLLFFVIVFILGGTTGWFVHQQLGNKPTVPVETVIAKPEVKIVESSLPKIQTETSNQDTYEMYKSMLQNPDLTFNEVDEMAAWVENINHDSSAKVIFDQDVEFVPTVSGYKEFVAHIRAGKLKEAKGVAQRKILSDVHLWQFRSCYKGWKDSEGEHSYTKEDRGLAEREFSSNYSSYTSFRDLDNVHFGKREWIESIREVRKNHDLSEERNNLH